MKKVLLDCGANKGQSYDVFFKNRDDADQYEIHCFEPSPTFSSYLSEKSATYHQEAVWIEDGTMDFYDKGNSLSGTIYKNKVDNKGGGEKIQVDCIDFSKFIIDNFNKDDYIIVKFDNEGNVEACDGTPHLMLANSFKRKNSEGKRVEIEGDARKAAIDFVESNKYLSIVEADPNAQKLLNTFIFL